MIKKLIFLTTIVVGVHTTGYSMERDRAQRPPIHVSDDDALGLFLAGAGTFLAIRVIAGAEHVSVDQRWESIGRILGAWGRGLPVLVPAVKDRLRSLVPSTQDAE